MICKNTQCGFQQVLPGVERKTLVHGDHTLMAEFRLERGSWLPHHAHHHEQSGYLVAGKMKLFLGNACFDVMPGDSWCIPGGTVHGAEVIEDTVAIEVFSPVREDYLDKGEGQ